MFQKITALAWKDTIIRFSSRTELLFFLILPLVFTVLLSGGIGGSLVGDGDNRIGLLVVNEDGSEPANALVAALAASDVVVMPSRSEGLGLAAIEALAAGRPVVAFDVGGLKEVVSEGVDGYCVPAGDEAAFAEAVIRLLADRVLLQRFGERARESAVRFGLPTHMERLLECYRSAAAGA